MKLDYIFIGLCNPGLKYENTRHNIGKIAVEYLLKKHSIEVKFYKKFNAFFGIGNIFEFKIGVLIPNTFMNNSGESIYKFKKTYSIDNKKIIIIHDDISIKLGNIKFKLNGSHGGHNGVKNILEILNDKKIPRIKIGIGIYDKKINNAILSEWIISKFSEDELFKLKQSITENLIKILFQNLK